MTCKLCNKDLSITQYYRTKTGYDTTCKECRIKKSKESYNNRRMKNKQIDDQAQNEVMKLFRYRGIDK